MNDKSLWTALKNGEHAALEQIYTEHVDYLLQYGYKFSRDPQLLEDAVHDLFLYIWKNRSGVSDTDSIRKYLTIAFRNTVLKKLKAASKIGAIEDDQIQFGASLSIDQIIIQGEIDEEIAKKLKTAFERLSARQKEVLYLKFYGDKSYEEIQDIMGINYQSLRNLVSGGIAALRNHLQTALLFFLALMST